MEFLEQAFHSREVLDDRGVGDRSWVESTIQVDKPDEATVQLVPKMLKSTIKRSLMKRESRVCI